MTVQELCVVDLFPSLLQPEGDHGNAVMLADRARRYGVPARCCTVHPGEQIPQAEVYLLGGSEDLDLVTCARELRASGVLMRAVESGAAVLGVGAGFTVLAREFEDATGRVHPGVGLLDVEMSWQRRADGPVVSAGTSGQGLPQLSGYEFHHGRANRGSGVDPFVRLEVGTGDGPEGAATDGAVSGRVIGSWLHGPLLPRNPAVADLLLGWLRPGLTTARAGAPGSIDDSLADVVRARRIAEARPTL